MTDEALQIRSEFYTKKNALLKAPDDKSNSRFVGHVFAQIAMDHLVKHLPADRYRLFLGPLWLRNLEWVEWDGAIIKREAKEIFQNYYEPTDIIALFEFKIAGDIWTQDSQGRTNCKNCARSRNRNKRQF